MVLVPPGSSCTWQVIAANLPKFEAMSLPSKEFNFTKVRISWLTEDFHRVASEKWMKSNGAEVLRQLRNLEVSVLKTAIAEAAAQNVIDGPVRVPFTAILSKLLKNGSQLAEFLARSGEPNSEFVTKKWAMETAFNQSRSIINYWVSLPFAKALHPLSVIVDLEK